jgi:photosystem II stability/assembly factor-like uncharacterized protein
MAEETLRSNLAEALDAGPDFPSRLLLSRTIAMLDLQVDRSHRTHARIRLGLHGAAPQLFAAVLIASMAVAAVAFFFATHHVPIPTQVHIPPVQVKSPGAAGCSSSCNLQPLAFISADTGWLIEDRGQSATSGGCNSVCPTGSVIVKTVDGGLHWKTQLTIGGSSQEILASPDGSELLVVPSPGQGAALYHSTDGGADWATVSLPTGNGQAVQTTCKFGTCFQEPMAEQLYFINPREGWVLALEPTFTVADLFHTTDSGAHWSLIRVAVKQAFGLDLAQGLNGQLIFNDSATGWFLPAPSWDIFMTHDGGVTWHRQSVPRPSGVTSDSGAFVDEVSLFSNGTDGVLSMHVRRPGLIGPAPTQSAPYRYVYTTSDGGNHWSNPSHPPAVAFIDATHWVGWPEPMGMGEASTAGFMRTSDAGRHWDVRPADFMQVESFQFLDPLRGWALASQSDGVSLYVTTDGGATWTPLKVPGLS